MGRKSNYIPFETAREFARSLGLKTPAQWRRYHEQHKPEGIPINPNVRYKNSGWVDYKDWLGEGSSLRWTKYTYEEAVTIIRANNIKTFDEYLTKCKALGLPAAPNRCYKGLGFVSFEVMSGHNPRKIIMRSFEDAREFVRSLKLKSWDEWQEYCKSGKKPLDIPSLPNKQYKGTGWVSFPDWLGNGNIRNGRNHKFWSYAEAIAFVHPLGFKTQEDYKKFSKTAEFPITLPKSPDQYYKRVGGWTTMGNFLGTGRIATQLRNSTYLPFEEGREVARELTKRLRLGGQSAWAEMCKRGEKPDNIPSDPRGVYGKKWKGWADWMGTTNFSKEHNPFPNSFTEVKMRVRAAGIKTITEYKLRAKELGLPVNPDRFYLKK